MTTTPSRRRKALRRSGTTGLAVALLLALAPAAGAAAPAAQPAPRWATVTASAATPSVHDDEAGGQADADDPAIWTSPTAPEQSVVLGALKNGGLDVHALDGSLLQHLDAPPAPEGAEEAGRYNNVDVVQGARIGARVLDLAVVSDRGRDRLRVFAIDPRGAAAGDAVLREVTDPAAGPVFSADEAEVDEQRTAYGLAAGLRADGSAQVLTTRRHTAEFAVLDLVAGPGGTVGYRERTRAALPTEFAVPGGTWTPCEEPGEEPQAEGSVFDAATGDWYVAQEDVGIWRVSGDTGSRWLLDRVRDFGVPATWDEASQTCRADGRDPGVGGTRLTADAEGLAIARDGHRRWLFASSQGDSTFAVYALGGPGPAGRYAGGFTVADSAEGIDGVQHSDGSAVTTAALGPLFPHGLFVTHDGESTRPGDEDRVSTGFRLVPLERITAPLGL
ncbi:phytase [Kineococcus sp. SYSU DK006]|uniref:phytase n=1 Tax=Kineococcus sp. SYSU DK006 TaxID=3383127 RepID=UPI003D7EE763